MCIVNHINQIGWLAKYDDYNDDYNVKQYLKYEAVAFGV